MPPRGGDTANSTNSYKINRYQQTWHTIEFSNNRHTRHHHNKKPCRDSLRSNFANLPDTRTQSKSTILTANHTSRNQPHPKPAHHKGEPFPGRSTRGLAAIFPHQRRRLRKQYTPPTPTANPPSAGSANPNLASLLGSAAITCQCRTWSVESTSMEWLTSHVVRSVSRRRPLEQNKGMWLGGLWTVPRMGHQRLVPGITDHCLDLK